MKKRNKMKVASLVLCGALLTGIVLTPVGAKAETIEGTGKAQNSTASVDNEGGFTAVEVPVKASTNGSDIVYNITVTSGAMIFSYCYGQTWDVVNHVYTDGTVGWNPANLDGENNKITVKNDSNYPVKATFIVEDPDGLRKQFNDSTDSNAVRGNFSDKNSAFVSGSGQSAQVTTQVSNGTTDYAEASLSLEMDARKLESGTVYYRKAPGIDATADDQMNKKDMFFALAGVPKKNINSITEVGKIKVTIAPEDEVSKLTK